MSAIMAINNVSMEEQIGMLTGVTEITRNASSASRGLVMISSRLTQVLDDTSSTGKKLTAIYDKLGIALKNENGQLRGHYEILGDLASKWNTLSENEQKYIALTSAGARQQQNFVALMENWNQVSNATVTAYESMGSAQRENEKVMDSIEKKTQVLKSEFQKLVIGDGGLQDANKVILDLGISLLQLANTPIGKIATEIGLLTAGIVGLTYAIESLTIAMASNPFILVAMALSSVIVLAIECADAEDELTRAHRENVEAVKEAQEEYDSLTTEIDKLKQALERIKDEKINISDKNDLAVLEAEEESLRRQIELLEAKAEIERKAAEKTAKEELKSTYTFVGNDGEVQELSRTDAIKEQKKMLEELSAEYDKLDEKERQQTADLSKMSDVGSEAYNNLKKEISETTEEKEKLGHQIEETENGFHDFLQETEDLGEALTSTDKETVQLREDLFKGVGEGLKYFKEQSLGAIKEELKQLGEGGNVDLTIRPRIDTTEFEKAKWDMEEVGEGYATVFTTTFSNEAKDVAINFTPIQVDENGNYVRVLDPDEFNEYCQEVVDGVREDDLQLQIGAVFEGEDAIEKADEAAQRIHELHEAETELTESIDAYNSVAEEEVEVTEDVEGKISELAKSLGLTATELESLNEQFDETQLINFLTKLNLARQTIADTSSTIDNLQSALQTATTALAEYNENGYLTIDTFQSLMGVSAQYLTALVNENGQLEINQSTLGKLIDKLKEAKVNELQAAETADILAYAQGNVADMSSLAKTALDNAGIAAKNAGSKAAEGASGFWTLADAIEAANDAAEGKKHIVKNQGIEAIHNAYSKLANEISNIKVNTTAAGNAAKSAGKKGSSAAKSATDATKELNKELEKTKSNYEKVISYINKQYDRKISDLGKEKDSATKPIEDEINALEKEKDAISDALQAEIDKREKQRDKYVDLIEEKIDAEEKERDTVIDSIEAKIDALEKERDALIESVDAKLDALEEEKDAILDNIEAETTALKEQKEERQKYWDAQIDALKKANDERKDALELQEKLDALERARNTKVKIYKEGQGFVYDVDQTKVAEAQKALDEYLSQKAYEDELERLTNLKNAEMDNYSDRIDALNKFKDETSDAYQKQINDLKKYRTSLQDEYKKQINALKDYKDELKKNYDLRIEEYKEYKDRIKEYFDTRISDLEEYKDSIEKNYDEQIDDLNEYKDALEQQYDDEIEMYNNYKDQFEDMVNAYQEQQDRLLAEQLTGISFENDNWMTRLDNLANFVNEYNRLQAQLDTGTTDNTNTATGSTGGGGGGGTTTTGTTTNATSTNVTSDGGAKYDDKGNKLNTGYTSTDKGTTVKKTKGYVPTSVGIATSGVISYANGVSSVKEDEIAIVGENPNKEIVLGSKVNNGELMSLNKGAGVVNADSSNTLASMLNQVGKFGSSGFGSGNGTLNNNINNDSLVVNGVTIEGSQISDPQTFVNGLLNLKSEALQRAYRHR